MSKKHSKLLDKGKKFIKDLKYNKEMLQHCERLYASAMIAHSYIRGAYKEAKKQGYKGDLPKIYNNMKHDAVLSVSSMANPTLLRQYNQTAYKYLLRLLNFLKREKVQEFKVKYKKKFMADVKEEIQATKNMMEE